MTIQNTPNLQDFLQEKREKMLGGVTDLHKNAY